MLETSYDRAVEQLLDDNFVIINVSRPIEEQFSSVFEAAHCFFCEPQQMKLLNRFPKDLGYRPFAGEYSKSPLHPDQVESFTVSPGAITVDQMTSDTGRLICERMLALYDTLESIAENLTVELANRLSESQIGNKLQGEFHRWSRLQLNYSRPREVQVAFINEVHEDGALFTIAHARKPGLELKVSDDKFVPVTNSPKDVLVIPGDIAWLLSGGRLRPMFHRVRPVSSYVERMALLFFADINPRLCDPWIRNEINQDVDIGAFVVTNPRRFGLEEWERD